MSFDPQIPSWGKSFLAKNLDNLTTLDLSTNQIFDISALKNLGNLENVR